MPKFGCKDGSANAETSPMMLQDATTARNFMLAGNATFTLVSKPTGKRYTYKVKESFDNPNLHFVSVMFGSDNHNDFAYLGVLRDGELRRTAKSKLEPTDVRVGALAWALNQLNGRDEMHPDLEFWHEGRCGRCNRKLTDPVSIARGLGPECAGK